MLSAWDIDGRWKVYPRTVVVERRNSVDHSLIFKVGGYTSMRHNSVTDSWDTDNERSVEMFRLNPHFCQSMKDLERKVNTTDNARLDISGRGLWNSCEKTFFDILKHPNSQSYSGKSLEQIYQQHEKKKDKYNQGVIDIKSSFNPLVFTRGGMAPESTKYWQKNSWKTQGTICICHDIRKDKVQIYPFEEHPCCNTRILRQTKWYPPLGPHRHWLQFNS